MKQGFQLQRNVVSDQFHSYKHISLPSLLKMSSVPRFTKSEFWMNGKKYLHQDGVVYTIRDAPKKAPKGVTWSVDMWKSRKAAAAIQKSFITVWEAAPLCESCGIKNSRGSTCDYCHCAEQCDKLRDKLRNKLSDKPNDTTPTELSFALKP